MKWKPKSQKQSQRREKKRKCVSDSERENKKIWKKIERKKKIRK